MKTIQRTLASPPLVGINFVRLCSIEICPLVNIGLFPRSHEYEYPISLHGRPRDNTDGEPATSLKKECVPNSGKKTFASVFDSTKPFASSEISCVLMCFSFTCHSGLHGQSEYRAFFFFAHIGVLYFERCWLEGQTGPKPWQKYKVGSQWTRFGRVKRSQNILPRNRKCHVFSRKEPCCGKVGGHRARAVVVGLWSVMLVCVHCDSAFV